MDKDITEEDIKKSIQIIALDNLYKQCKISLEEDDLSEEDYDYLIVILHYSREMLFELGKDLEQENPEPITIQRPSWKKQ